MKVADVSEIPAGAMKMAVYGGTEVLIVNFGGAYYAINNKCTHAGARLSEGKLEGAVVTCPKHGSRFDVTSGKALSGPKIGFLKLKGKDVAAYDVRVDGTAVLIRPR